VTCALAIPVLLASACVEVYVWPHVLRAGLARRLSRAAARRCPEDPPLHFV
jgi:hypothetical protein